MRYRVVAVCIASLGLLIGIFATGGQPASVPAPHHPLPTAAYNTLIQQEQGYVG